ncbi:signal transduction histidine kinase [Ruminococcus sp. CAG:17]|nr:signal transduction histidine kinase [Ruminococcus sp. CAG:17]
MLQLLGKCSGADRVYIFDKKEKNRKEYFCLQYEWKNEDDILEKEQLFSEITVEDIPHWTDELKKGLTIQVTDCEELSPMEQEYNLMKKHHTYSRVLAPIFSRDHLSGFIGMDHFYKGISELFIHQLAFVGAHLNTARENLRMFTLLGKNLESMEKERQILNVLCEDCTSVYKVNLLDDTAEVVKLEQGANAPKILKNREKIILCYSKELKYYYDHFVIKESAPDFPVLIAFRHVDEIIKEERNHQRELEDSLAEVKMNNEIISAISKIYYMIYRIDLQDFYYEEITGGSENHRFTGMKGTAAAHITSDSSEKVASKYRAMVKQFYDLSTLKKRLEKEESIAVDYLATDNNWHLARFIVQSRAEDGTARQVLLVIRVISEEKRREKYLIDAVEEANRANEAKSEFLSRMSHDIRTPMNAIMGFTRVARNHLHEPDKILDCLDKINLSGSNLQQLINDVLDISRIESGEFRIDSEPVKLSELCELYEQNIRGTAEDKNQKFICNRHDIIYDTVLSDRLRIGQIYMNLLSNAVKYTPEGGTVELEVYEEPFPDKDKIRLVSIVRDNGIGMSEKFMKEMYSQFSRAIDTRVNKVQGSGLGLAIVKKIVDQMNGTIEATSRLHEGTTFRVTLDVPFIREQEVSETTAEIPFFKLRPSRIIKTLLIAEDNDLNYEILEEQLEMYGIHCVRAVNGKECVQLFEIDSSGTYDAILMDMQMPVMNGLDATRAIRRLPSPESKQIPIIALTANAYLEDVQKCKEAGMNDHMSKPVQIEQIIRTVERWMK